MGKIKAVFFDVDNTLYDTATQVESARKNVIKAMREAGLDIEENEALARLNRIVKNHGSNYGFHYDRLLESFNIKPNPRIVSAGLVAYANAKSAYIVPYAETVPTLIRLVGMELKLGIISEGVPVKQWEKLIRLGLQHFFDVVAISKEHPNGKSPELFVKACHEVKCKQSECMMVGDRLDKDIAGAKKAGLTTVQVLTRRYSKIKPRNEFEKPDYRVENLWDLVKLIKKINKR
ncbi:MAG: TIGR02253 family HAD-type hydrolase [Candidatus Altiarchaeota archaeon]